MSATTEPVSELTASPRLRALLTAISGRDGRVQRLDPGSHGMAAGYGGVLEAREAVHSDLPRPWQVTVCPAPGSPQAGTTFRMQDVTAWSATPTPDGLVVQIETFGGGPHLRILVECSESEAGALVGGAR